MKNVIICMKAISDGCHEDYLYDNCHVDIFLTEKYSILYLVFWGFTFEK